MMREEHLPETEAKVGHRYGHVQADPKDHHCEACEVPQKDEEADDFDDGHHLEGMAG